MAYGEPSSLTPGLLTLGCEVLGGTDWGAVDLKDARRAVRCALDRGIKAFDTADVYGLGRGEEELSSALGTDRHRVTVITKGGVRWTPAARGGRARTVRDASPAHLSEAINASLRRLRLECIPLYLVHWPDPATPLHETLEYLERARADGRILSYGLSNFPAADVVAAAGGYSVSAYQGRLNLLSPPSALAELSTVRMGGVATLTYGALAQGLLTGKYTRDSTFPESDRRHRLPLFSLDTWRQQLPVLRTLDAIAREVGLTPAQVALRWVLDSGLASSVVVGARSPKQVLENTDVLGKSLDQRHHLMLEHAREEAALHSFGT